MRKIVRLIPKDKIMIETDGPFLTPQSGTPPGFRVRRNEPAFLPMILKELASCMEMTPEELAEASTKNANTFFNLPEASTELETTETQAGVAIAGDFPPLGAAPSTTSNRGRGNGQSRGGRVQRGGHRGGYRGRGQ